MTTERNGAALAPLTDVSDAAGDSAEADDGVDAAARVAADMWSTRPCAAVPESCAGDSAAAAPPAAVASLRRRAIAHGASSSAPAIASRRGCAWPWSTGLRRPAPMSLRERPNTSDMSSESSGRDTAPDSTARMSRLFVVRRGTASSTACISREIMSSTAAGAGPLTTPSVAWADPPPPRTALAAPTCPAFAGPDWSADIADLAAKNRSTIR